MSRVVVICSGNICRSPMAEGLLKKEFELRGLTSAISSMGTLGIWGSPAARGAILVCGEVGVDLSGHRSRGLIRDELMGADVIMVMEEQHVMAVETLICGELSIDGCKSIEGKIVRLWEYLGESWQAVPDPVGQSVEVFRASRDLIHKCICGWLQTSLVGQ